MSSFRFSALKDRQVLAFDPAVDVLQFDRAVWPASQLGVVAAAAGVRLTMEGKTVQLEGVRLAELSSAHVTFADGSQLLVGDDAPGLGDGVANTLTGGAGSDYLDGLGGADVLTGGPGDDTYVVNAARDQIVEQASEGFDTVWSTVSYRLPANVEQLRLLGEGAVNGTGNALGNVLYASVGDNVLAGGAGSDTVSYEYGATAGVRVSLATTAAQATGGSGSDTLQGFEHLSGARYGDVLTGSAGANVLEGGGGADVLRGGAGDDVLVVQDLRFRSLSGGAGMDTVRLAEPGLTLDLTTLGSKVTGIEVLELTGASRVVLDAAAVTALSDTTDRQRIEGGAGAVVEAGAGWVPGLAAVQGGERYHTYTQGATELWLSEAIGSVSIAPAAVRSLADLNGTNGFRLDGVAEGDGSGHSVSAAGDVNGDGFGDLIIGAMGADPNGDSSGSSYVVFGQASGFAATLSLSALNGTNGFRLDGVAEGDRSGLPVSAAGDVNGDGFDDLLVGASGADPNGTSSGSSYVVFGQASGFAATLPLLALNGTNGFRLDGVAANDNSGGSVSAAGDVNGDGFDDLLIGASGADPNGDYSGSSYVVFGQASGFVATLPLSALNGVNGFRLDGVGFNDGSGSSVSAAGDVNGDGFDDLIIGALGAGPNGAFSGSSYVVFGKVGVFAATVSLAALDGTDGCRVDGAAAFDRAGRSVSAAGDVNADGFDDLIIGASGAGPNGDDSGSSYVVFGRASGFASTLSLSALDGTNGFRLDGAVEGDYAGVEVSAAGDVNGDGFDDLLVGAPRTDPNGYGAGSSFVIFGQASGFRATQSLSALDGTNGFRLDGVAAYDHAGESVSAAGDVNGDGFDDLLIGAPGADPNSPAAGSSYVVFGGNFTGAVTKLGTEGNDRLLGTAAAERFVGAQGKDLLDGRGGADAFEGGAGDDRIRVTDLQFRAVDGGLGDDTLQLVGDGLTLGLTRMGTRLEGIETLELSGASRVILDATSVVGLSTSTNVLRIDGAVGTVVELGAGWLPGVDVVQDDGQRYRTFSQGPAALAIDAVVQIARSPVLPLAELDGTNGFRMDGVGFGDGAGRALRGAGDVNGDGFDDLIIGALRADVSGENAGASYVVFGQSGGFSATLPLSGLDGTNGFRLDGVASGDQSGWSVSGAGDVNGDGFADLIIGANGADPNGDWSGASYVVFGRPGGFGSSVKLSDLDGTHGFRLAGVAAGDWLGWSVAGAGDVNGDGFDDVLVGAYGADPNGDWSGASYLVFGKAAGFEREVALSALDGTNGFRVDGVAAYDGAGRSVSSAGDVNGDGFDDLLIGALHADPNGDGSGASYLVFGKAGGFSESVNLSDLNGRDGFRLDGVTGGDWSGYWVSGAGDVNGDGFDDLIIGADGADPNGGYSGSSYVVFGQASGFAAALQLSALDGTNGFRLEGAAAFDSSGHSVSGAGDVNGDGFDDLLIGALGADPNGDASGASYLVFGKASGFSASIDLSGLDGTNGFRLDGMAADDIMGWCVSAAGDINGDGFDDLTTGAPNADPNLADSGAGYVVFGGNFTGAVTKLGTAGADLLAGTAAAERFVGGQGDDVLDGQGGADGFDGGAGNDRIQVADLSFQRVDGGSGLDTLAMTGEGQTLDLAEARGRVAGVERIDLTGSGDNGVVLSVLDVLGLSDSSNRLIVDGDVGDRVTVQDQGWVPGLALVEGGERYHAYTQGAAELWLSEAIGTVSVPPIVARNLADLNGANGFRLDGAAAGDGSGHSVSAAGDVNGDGFDDLIIGAWGADPNGQRSGSSYVVFGQANGFVATLPLSTLRHRPELT